MRSMLEEEDEELVSSGLPSNFNQRDREVALSSTTLLVIFFGLALVCALCFAFGYTLGRRSDPTQTVSASSPGSGAYQPPGAQFSSQPKPSAASQSASQHSPGSAPSPETDNLAQPESTDESAVTTQRSTLEDSPPAGSGSASRNPAPLAQTAPAPPQKPALPATLTQPLTQTSAPAPQDYMVQIAAVSNPADADVLVSALRKRGYSVAVRHDPSDTLMHVQVGPFTARADAAEMRRKLLADGYNAILK